MISDYRAQRDALQSQVDTLRREMADDYPSVLLGRALRRYFHDGPTSGRELPVLVAELLDLPLPRIAVTLTAGGVLIQVRPEDGRS
jgi:hypothetical protein